VSVRPEAAPTLKLWYRVWIGIGNVVRRLTLQNYRNTARVYWPQVGRIELHVTALVLFALNFHGFFLARLWSNAARLRRRWSIQPGSGRPTTVVHVTSSFDLGGTQKQIKNLCTAPSARLRHTTVEVFPEINFLYRQGEAVEPERYIVGGLWQRAVGRIASTFSTRSPQLIQVYKIYRDLVAQPADVAVGWGHEMCATTFLAATFARVPHIVFCIRTFNPAFGWTSAAWGELLRTAHREMSPHVSAILTNSTPLREDHARWVGIDSARIGVCANGIELVRLSEAEIQEKRRAMRRQLGIDEDVKVAINVGRFSAEKGQHTIIAVNERLMRDYGNALVWLLCGDGPTLDGVRRQAEVGGMTNVRFLGRITGVYDYLCASDIFVMPSDFEGMPNAMMEAMACGLPCISTDRSGAVDVARHGHEALFYQVGDLAAMEQHVRFLLDHPGDARAMGRRARERLGEFSIDRSVACFEQIIDAAIPRHDAQDIR
jgi:glycosyltransferase involved in cell wall biosynthesis